MLIKVEYFLLLNFLPRFIPHRNVRERTDTAIDFLLACKLPPKIIERNDWPPSLYFVLPKQSNYRKKVINLTYTHLEIIKEGRGY